MHSHRMAVRFIPRFDKFEHPSGRIVDSSFFGQIDGTGQFQADECNCMGSIRNNIVSITPIDSL